MNKPQLHQPVLTKELEQFLPAPLNSQAQAIDATFGTGGHSKILAAKGFSVLGIEADPEMLPFSKALLKDQKIKVVNANFRDIREIAQREGFEHVSVILFDLGVSNIHLTDTGRGFSFSNPEAPLDMRIDKSLQGLTAADLLNALREDQLIVLFGKVLRHFASRRLAKAVIAYRADKKIATVGDLSNISKVVRAKSHLHQATLPFLALRIAVNSELENIEEALPKAFELLVKDGRLFVITFHSLEKAIVDAFFEKMENEGFGKRVTRNPVLASSEEVEGNPRCRSAKMQILARL